MLLRSFRVICQLQHADTKNLPKHDVFGHVCPHFPQPKPWYGEGCYDVYEMCARMHGFLGRTLFAKAACTRQGTQAATMVATCCRASRMVPAPILDVASWQLRSSIYLFRGQVESRTDASVPNLHILSSVSMKHPVLGENIVATCKVVWEAKIAFGLQCQPSVTPCRPPINGLCHSPCWQPPCPHCKSLGSEGIASWRCFLR